MKYSAVLEYIEGYWSRIVRRTVDDQGMLIGLPKSYLIPADSEVFQEMFYWDSYFTCVGLAGTDHEGLIVDVAENMMALLKRFGMIPRATRFYYTSRSQPPFSTATFRLAFEVKKRRGDEDAEAFLRESMSLAAEEHRGVWLGEAEPHARRVFGGLSRYFDVNCVDMLAGDESGWSGSTRCDGRWLEHLPVCLNSILYRREMDLAWASELLGDTTAAADWSQAAKARAATMRELMWDAGTGFFFDYDYVTRRRCEEATLAGFYPLWAGVASPEEARGAVQEWLPRFLKTGGLVTGLTPRDRHQFTWPNGWAPLHWIVVSGLESYGFTQEARAVMRAWCDNCATVFDKSGQLWEKYNVVEVGAAPVSPHYGNIGGFGWTNSVFADFYRRLEPQREPEIMASSS